MRVFRVGRCPASSAASPRSCTGCDRAPRTEHEPARYGTARHDPDTASSCPPAGGPATSPSPTSSTSHAASRPACGEPGCPGRPPARGRGMEGAGDGGCGRVPGRHAAPRGSPRAGSAGRTDDRGGGVVGDRVDRVDRVDRGTGPQQHGRQVQPEALRAPRSPAAPSAGPGRPGTCSRPRTNSARGDAEQQAGGGRREGSASSRFAAIRSSSTPARSTTPRIGGRPSASGASIAASIAAPRGPRPGRGSLIERRFSNTFRGR